MIPVVTFIKIGPVFSRKIKLDVIESFRQIGICRSKKMETNRLFIRPMREFDQSEFLSGISDRTLRVAYGFPKDMDEITSLKVFRRFCELPGAYSILEKQTDNMILILLQEKDSMMKR